MSSEVSDGLSRLGGVIFRVCGCEDYSFLPATIAVKVIPVPKMAEIPGSPPELRGVALVDGDMIPIVEVWGDYAPPSTEEGNAMLVCVVLGEAVGLVGIEVIATGAFESIRTESEAEIRVRVPPRPHEDVEAADLIVARPEEAAIFDVGAVIGRVREGRWAV